MSYAYPVSGIDSRIGIIRKMFVRGRIISVRLQDGGGWVF